MATGWTWEYVDEFMTIPRLVEMQKYLSSTACNTTAPSGAGAGKSFGEFVSDFGSMLKCR